jgi:hypothetical protein
LFTTSTTPSMSQVNPPGDALTWAEEDAQQVTAAHDPDQLAVGVHHGQPHGCWLFVSNAAGSVASGWIVMAGRSSACAPLGLGASCCRRASGGGCPTRAGHALALVLHGEQVWPRALQRLGRRAYCLVRQDQCLCPAVRPSGLYVWSAGTSGHQRRRVLAGSAPAPSPTAALSADPGRPVPCQRSHTGSELVFSVIVWAALRYSLIKPWTTWVRLIRAVTSTDSRACAAEVFVPALVGPMLVAVLRVPGKSPPKVVVHRRPGGGQGIRAASMNCSELVLVTGLAHGT